MKIRNINARIYLTAIVLLGACATLPAEDIFTPDEIAMSVSPRDLPPPKPTKQGNLPRRGENASESGMIKVAFLLDTEGKVLDPRIASSTNEKLNDFALRTVSKWEFEPMEKDGHKVIVRIIVPLLFKVED